ncbi:hypothetical protein BEN47_05150 [Hymenobacter lapidarius]|uniref:Uncharacterized protein n=1 Tax=Hymenobacter lapidarius TaxID=1908237 RepID=A0A1G1STS1_9BACT|nr:hypothetical protein [Hymenobacter lapidarius]OGX82009.1 hypothetical protein BEN47_05150 [Hymenobacter lapidarius]
MNQQLLDALEQIVARIPVLDATRQYWFIRTNGGAFFQDFLDSGSVGIGYNLVTYAQIKRALVQRDKTEGGILGAIINRYPEFDKNKLGRVLGLFTRFYTDMQEGDVVVMPSAGSNEYAFGIVTGDEAFEVDTTTTDDKTIYRKRRRVEWVARKPSRSLDSNLYEAFRAPQAMSTLNPHASYLDREMHSIYTKDGQTHVRLDITTPDGIDGRDYFAMGGALFALCEQFCEDANIDAACGEIDVRQNIQSPGVLEFIGKNRMVTTFLASTLTVALFGGHVKADALKIDIGTEGIFPIMLEAYKEHNRQENMRAVLARTLGAMEAKQGLDMLRIVAGQAPVEPRATEQVSETMPVAAVDTSVTGAISAAGKRAATASLSQSPTGGSSPAADNGPERPAPTRQ